MKHEKIFLIGGCDLEMANIKEVLTQHGIEYIDRGLMWHNAKLSRYSDILSSYAQNKNIRIYGIELQEDIAPPANYITIDHHNLLSNKDSALEQVLEIIDQPISRFHQLVAANDKGYIPALKAIGASNKEIEEIRLLDRQAQGVTSQEEELAIDAILHQTEYKTDQLIVVKALCSRFSPISDRLYPYKRLLIYTDQELMFYGYEAQKIRENLIIEVKPFYGGGDNGYWGIPKDALSPNQIKGIVSQIIKTIEHV